jgi:hypothetical protein
VTLRRLNITKYSKDSEGSVMDVTHGEMVEAKLNRLIEKCSSRETDPDERDELWAASVAAYNARRREENRLAWCEYHRGQAERHRTILEALIADHEAQAEKYELGAEGE